MLRGKQNTVHLNMEKERFRGGSVVSRQSIEYADACSCEMKTMEKTPPPPFPCTRLCDETIHTTTNRQYGNPLGENTDDSRLSLLLIYTSHPSRPRKARGRGMGD